MKTKKLLISIISGLVFITVIFNFYQTFSLDSNYTFQSQIYKIENEYIENISPNTTIENFYKYFDNENCTIKVVDDKNKELTKNYVYNGSKTLLYNNDNKLIKEYINIIKGDLVADGIINDNDLREFGSLLVKNYEFNSTDIKTLDIDNDGIVEINDLVLINKYKDEDYKDIALNYEEYTLLSNETLRLIPTINPSIIKDQNLNWQSSNQDVATIDETGLITALSEGTTTITATTKDNKITKKMMLTVDNTIKLTQTEGEAYVDGYDLEIGIRAIEYDSLTCESDKPNLSTCRIEDRKLIINAIFDGNSTITVKSATNGTATFNVRTYSTSINILPNYGCMRKNIDAAPRISSFNAGVFSYDISDKEIIKNAYVEGNLLRVFSGTKAGRATVTVKGSTTKNTGLLTVDVYSISIPAMGLAVGVGQENSTEIAIENGGTLICENPNEDVATCRIENDRIYITGLKTGASYMKIKNKINYNGKDYDCGEASFTVVVY